MNAVELEKRLTSCESLPALPLALQKVQKLLNDPKSTMAQIATVIATDQALASKTLKLVNSAFYGMTRPISSITQAIVILGLNTLSHLMLGLSVAKLFPQGKHPFDLTVFWQHAFGVALIAKGIAEALRYEQPEECFIGGLMHDIGRLVLQQNFYDDYVRVIAMAKRKQCTLVEAEIAVFGADHSYAGGFIAEKWKIPPVLFTAIKYHHSLHCIPPELGSNTTVARIVAESNTIAGNEKIGDPDSAYAPKVFPHEISQQTLDKIVIQTKSTIEATIRQWQMDG
jgi:putative nucleotidyltransferase with HDIG domain